MSEFLKRHNVHISGNGSQPMVFVHGLGCNQQMWRSVAPAFENDYKVILLDLIGSGASDIAYYVKEKYNTLYGCAEDIIEIVATLKLKDVIYVGHSVGAIIGMLAAIEKPDCFKAMIMLAPSPCYINKEDYVGGFNLWEMKEILSEMKGGTTGWSDKYVPLILNTKDAPEETTEMQQSFCNTDPEILQQFAEATFLSDHRFDLPRLQVPSLIMQCSDDLIAPEAVGDYMNDQMPQSNLVKLKATGHCPHLTAPEETIEVILEYLRGLDPVATDKASAGK